MSGPSGRKVVRSPPANVIWRRWGWIESTAFPVPPFVTIAQFQAAARARFLAFDSSPAFAFVCARAASISPTSAPEPTFFTRALVAMLATSHPSVNERDQRRVAATLRYFASAQFWARMRTGFEMSAPAIADVFDRTVAEALGDVFVFRERGMDSASPRASA